ncbi:hypothetical protein GQ55_3G074100 [Panicum hallii var. hallii]|uniref:Uncharacterized protein n=1 Tax=Panicum hallii var. hallii TaxID=1504633 RepID=A0A2T7E6R0_9POAL|nr:hypothetical protein GQ55_3G074100 [Panicum hallii var. hallii]
MAPRPRDHRPRAAPTSLPFYLALPVCHCRGKCQNGGGGSEPATRLVYWSAVFGACEAEGIRRRGSSRAVPPLSARHRIADAHRRGSHARLRVRVRDPEEGGVSAGTNGRASPAGPASIRAAGTGVRG